MPNLHLVDPEKGNHASTSYAYDTKPTAHDEPFVHGAGTVAEETGRGGDTHRGLKSRHIQFLYVLVHVHPQARQRPQQHSMLNSLAGPSVVPSEQDCLSAAVPFLPSSAPPLSSWPISP
jgi:hypothetical protein